MIETISCDGPAFTIFSSADAEQLAGCQVYDGNVIIDSSVSGSVQLNGVQQITGDLICKNATELTALSSDNLTTIAGTFDLERLIILSTLQFDELAGVSQISWNALPALQHLKFARGISQADYVSISDTVLLTLEGITLTAVAGIDLNNNQFLVTVSLNDLSEVHPSCRSQQTIATWSSISQISKR